MFHVFSQADPGWGNELMACGQPIRRKGCLITCIAMILDYYIPNFTDPGIFNEWLITNNGCDSNTCDYIWNMKSAENYTGGLITKDKSINYFDYKRVDDNLKNGFPVIVRVLNNKGTYHWIVIIGKENGVYLINDPGYYNRKSLDGDNKYLGIAPPSRMILYSSLLLSNCNIYQWNFNQQDAEDFETKFEGWRIWNDGRYSTDNPLDAGDIAVAPDGDRICLIIDPGAFSRTSSRSSKRNICGI